MDLAELAAKVQAAGVVGAGGGGFPTHVKLNNRCDTVLVNGAECEPLLQVDQQLLEREAPVLVDTLASIVESTGAGQGILALKAKYKAARVALEGALTGRDHSLCAGRHSAVGEGYSPAEGSHFASKEGHSLPADNHAASAEGHCTSGEGRSPAGEGYLVPKGSRSSAGTGYLTTGESCSRVGRGRLAVCPLEDFYPAGDEQVLVYEVLGRVVPQGGIPLHVGVIVLNVETLLNIGKALAGQSVTHKYVSVVGAVANPLTVCVPVGTPVAELLAMAGGSRAGKYRVLDGGPMMGREVRNLNQGISKTTKGLLVLPANHPLWRHKEIPTGIALKRAMSVCCQCFACTDLCPRYLLGHTIEPHRVMRSLVHNVSTDARGVTGAQYCSECGVCDNYACPMDISPRLINQAVKRELAQQGFRPVVGGEGRPRASRSERKVPVKRLISRLGLDNYHRPAPLMDAPGEPTQVILELKQHAGAPCYPVVQPGAKVEMGQVVAEVPEGQLGSRLHAGITGTVLRVSPQIVIAR
ncbi:Respiratory-chain NADH dehydrogenase 51 Kd subunit [Acididesulfobacillus acetoxydans]|uniref:Respiratory-chain NADH dehydrogenase 51 Kd subunit n=1 Tax=Acididesulfobacillus acetoxydans TaxID=1561005 RepID=A0A8S0WNF8_9FIRM|nr:4Fe-4S dicluster domain-containing protein [Acididesulfobacillus acetoxydans]CAA7601304.1 Respiratory-chain NADH dehydrogenase 51 Kd subunit [Acididesulfobacillus acetoxydans]CEJ08786.1 Respiratory-chain NADH dehydrogenase domain 51 kDa subunit [Acididesulfobacillus acetoxydans]